MSLRALPLLVFAFILYNVIVLTIGIEGLNNELFSIQLLSGGVWTFTMSDLVKLLVLILLFAELLKSTFTSTSTLIDHALSMVLFVAILVEFLVVPQAATSAFFILVVGSLIDVIAGYTIGIRVARRDFSIGDM